MNPPARADQRSPPVAINLYQRACEDIVFLAETESPQKALKSKITTAGDLKMEEEADPEGFKSIELASARAEI